MPSSGIKNQLWKLINHLSVGDWVLRYHPKSYLKNIGWFRSLKEMKAVDGEGRPIPWLPYPFINFLEPRLQKEFRMFEYGCGYSTNWYAERVQQIIAVENNRTWYEQVSSRLLANGKVIFQAELESYVNEPLNHLSFEIIVIDGVNRQYCLEPAFKALLPTGVIVWDNSDRDDFRMSADKIRQHGFREITFAGLAPSAFVFTQTSILYRPGNCLGI